MVQSMSEDLARMFAGILTKGDVFELFKMLEQRYGTISETCARIGIERKTFYNWRNARQMSIGTKIKVLAAALEEHPINTLEFIAGRARGKTKEALEFLIEFLYREILMEEEPKRLEELAIKAREIIDEYSTPITEYLAHEIDNLREVVLSKGYRLETISTKPVVSLSVQMRIDEAGPLSAATMYSYGSSREAGVEEQPPALLTSESMWGA